MVKTAPPQIFRYSIICTAPSEVVTGTLRTHELYTPKHLLPKVLVPGNYEPVYVRYKSNKPRNFPSLHWYGTDIKREAGNMEEDNLTEHDIFRS
jgi:hypothetical protein